MKRRITFVYEQDRPFDPKQLEVDKKSLHIKSLEAAREERWTINLFGLPQEVWKDGVKIWLALKQVHELHVRWTLAAPQFSTAPFVSAVSPGLHVLFTPQKDRSAVLLCPLIVKVFGGDLNCTIPEDAFTRTASMGGRPDSSASLQYYEYQPSTINLVRYIQEKICPKKDNHTCRSAAGALAEADYVDIDYDTISQSLHLSAFWRAPPTGAMWNEVIKQPRTQNKIEIGVFASQKATRPEDISLGGYLITLGQDAKPNPTLFSFPSRHHASPSNYTVSFIPPTGLHPTLRLAFPPSTHAPSPSCTLHTYLTLPSTLFPDKYQLSQPNLLKSNNLASLRALSPPAPDLEAPVWTTREWGSALLLELSPPPTTSSSSSSSSSDNGDNNKNIPASWHALIPLHLRYLPPSTSHSSSSQRRIPIPDPIVFWACPSPSTEEEEDDDGGGSAKLDTNPFDRTNLGYDTLFGPRTLFYHLQRSGQGGGGGGDGSSGVQMLEVPVLDVGRSGWVEMGTGVAVLVGAAWVVWCLVQVVALGRNARREQGVVGARKKTE